MLMVYVKGFDVGIRRVECCRVKSIGVVPVLLVF